MIRYITMLITCDRILDFYTFIPFLQEVQDGLCMGNRGFGSEGPKQIKMASAWVTEGLILADGGSVKSNCFVF